MRRPYPVVTVKPTSAWVMPSCFRAPAIDALTPSSLTAPMLSMQDATMLPCSSRMMVFAVVEPKSIPIAYVVMVAPQAQALFAK